PRVRSGCGRSCSATSRPASGRWTRCSTRCRSTTPTAPALRDTSGIERNLRRGEDGRWYWHWDPAYMLGRPRAAAEQGLSLERERLQAAARALTVPTLLVRGRMSDILSEEGAREMLELAPHARYVDVADAGHMVAGDRNDAFNAAVVDFLASVRGGG